MVSNNAYINAKKEDEYYRYHLEADIKKYAPAVPILQILVAPPKGKYCNNDYKFCPYLLLGGYCTKHRKVLQSLDGQQYTIIKSGSYNVAVGAYRVFKKRCNGSQSDQLSMF